MQYSLVSLKIYLPVPKGGEVLRKLVIQSYPTFQYQWNLMHPYYPPPWRVLVTAPLTTPCWLCFTIAGNGNYWLTERDTWEVRGCPFRNHLMVGLGLPAAAQLQRRSAPMSASVSVMTFNHSGWATKQEKTGAFVMFHVVSIYGVYVWHLKNIMGLNSLSSSSISDLTHSKSFWLCHIWPKWFLGFYSSCPLSKKSENHLRLKWNLCGLRHSLPCEFGSIAFGHPLPHHC